MATQIATAELPVIRAAGGIMLRGSPTGDEVMIVFRARHQDWTLPKGKLKGGETFQEAALREVEEETGCRCDLGDYLGMISYAHRGVPKVVMFWRMTVLEERPRPDGDEITQALWLPIPAAIQCLTYAQEKALLTHVAAPRTAQPTDATGAESEPETELASGGNEQLSVALLDDDSPSSQPAPPALKIVSHDAESSDTLLLQVVSQPTLEVMTAASEAPLELSSPPTALSPAFEASPVFETPPGLESEAASQDAPALEPETTNSPLIDLEPYFADPEVEALESEQEEVPAAAPATPQVGAPLPPKHSLQSRRGRTLHREIHAFRVEMDFLARRGPEGEDSWPVAARHHLSDAAICLEKKDFEGGWHALRSARRYAVRGLTPAELAARAQLLRDEAVKILSWRGAAIERLLAVPDDQLTPPRLADAMLLRDEDDADQKQRSRTSAMRLGLIVVLCMAGASALVVSRYASGPFQYHALLAFLGLLGAALSAAQQILRQRHDGKIFESITILALVFAGAIAGLAADAIYQYLGRYVHLRPAYELAVYAFAFLLGYAAERSLSFFAGFSREQDSVRY